MSQHLSFYALLALVVAISILFYRVVEPFVVVLFIAAVLAVLFRPFAQRLTTALKGRNRIAAAITTACVVFLLVLPIGAILIMAGGQLATVSQQVVAWFERTDGGNLEQTLEALDDNTIGRRLQLSYRRLSESQQVRLKEAAGNVTSGFANELVEKTQGIIGDLFQAVIGFAIMALGLYYFLVDGRMFLVELHRMLPFEKSEEQQLFEQFQLVCRGVVLGTVVAGLAQAALAGVAFAVLGIGQVWLLVVLTLFCSFIPFVGAFSVWAPVAIYLALNGEYASAIGLIVFGGVVISTSDNLIRAYVIGEEAKLHPLVALVSVLGALQLVGLWGIFIGPMVAAFLYALIQILRHRLLG
jgi:predicted PurR-regulated permease PerM